MAPKKIFFGPESKNLLATLNLVTSSSTAEKENKQTVRLKELFFDPTATESPFNQSRDLDLGRKNLKFRGENKDR